jgi:uncharacterized membrane protein (UPF0182 family)
MRQNDPFNDLLRSLEDNLQREGGLIPPDDNRPVATDEGGGGRRILWILLPLLLLVLFNRLMAFYTDLMWYQSLNLEAVFATRLWAQLGLFAAGALFFWLVVALNVWFARRFTTSRVGRTPVEAFADGAGISVTGLLLGAGAVVAILVGISTSGQWEPLLVFLNQRAFGAVDPLFNRDISFFLFTLPVWSALRTWLLFLLVVTVVATALANGVFWRGWRVGTGALAHLATLGALILLLVAWQYRLDAFQLVYSSRGAVVGAGYADVYAQLPAYNILFVVTLITAVLLLVTVFLRRAWRAMVVGLGVWVLVAVVAGNVYPGLVQRFQVSPNELNLERPFIEHNIAYTRMAYDLDSVEVQPYEVSGNLTAQDLLAEQDTVRNVRLWDYRPLLQTYNQIQALRQYYVFNDVDVDRYMIDGDMRQVMIAARELVGEQLSQDAQTWVNRRLVYTHGFGVAASPVSQVTREGLPDFYLKDLPPQGVLTVTQPQIYFGELADNYVVARTLEPEFSYPSGDGNVTTHFSADTGIRMSLWARLLFAIRFADINLLLNQDITPESQLLWRRDIVERVRTVAPFLSFDRDPYIVVDDAGRLFWILDAYTTSNRFPYSTPLESINYIRNPVKVVINAYDGVPQFFLIDPEEPIAAAYARIFPTLFVPFSEMSESLRNHLRYPEDIFTVQAEVFRTYHMTDVNEFYNREDLWSWPQELVENTPQRVEPYYVLMQLPNDEQLEYVQILPFTPANRENLIAWLAARSNPDRYGEKIVYEFGKDSLFFGPSQIESRIDQDPEISAQLTLWNQQGSGVRRGNLLVIPVAGSLLYVEPLYLQSVSGRIPELQRVIVATAQRIVMAENFGLALVELFGPQVLAEPGLAELAAFGLEGSVDEALEAAAAGTTGAGLDLATVDELIVEANRQFERAQEYSRAGDWAGYGIEIAALEETLGRLAELTGATLVEPTPIPDDSIPTDSIPTDAVTPAP